MTRIAKSGLFVHGVPWDPECGEALWIASRTERFFAVLVAHELLSLLDYSKRASVQGEKRTYIRVLVSPPASPPWPSVSSLRSEYCLALSSLWESATSQSRPLLSSLRPDISHPFVP